MSVGMYMGEQQHHSQSLAMQLAVQVSVSRMHVVLG